MSRVRKTISTFLEVLVFAVLQAAVCLFLLVSDGYAQGKYHAVECEDKRDYLATCSALESTAKCSRQLTELCCSCQSTWQMSIAYCSFSYNSLAAPTPGTSDSRPPKQLPEGTTVSKQSCDSGITSFLIEGHPKEGSGLSYEWLFTCHDSAGNQGIELLPASSVVKTDGGRSLTVSLPTPGISTEYVCLAEFQIFRNGVQASSYKSSLLVTSCELGCSSSDLQPALLSMDSVGADQKRIGRTAIGILKKAGQLSKKKQNTFTEGINSNYIAVWNSTWAIPVVAAQCQNVTHCQIQSLSESRKLYEDNVKKAHSLLKKILKSNSKMSSHDVQRLKALKIKADKAQQAGLKMVATLPSVTSVCQAPLSARLSTENAG